MDALDQHVAQVLAARALERSRVTYPDLASEIGWNHPTGRGLGTPLWNVLNFCKERALPILTSILVKKGTRVPPDDAMAYIRQVFGEVDILEEQERAFRFNWAVVPELGLLAAPEPEIDYTRIYASRMYGFAPEQWGMLGFTRKKTRDDVLAAMGDKPIYVVFFCSPHAEIIEGTGGRVTIAKDDRARVLGIAEVQPVMATPQTHLAPVALKEMHDLWGKLRWEYGLEISRAWKMPERPMTSHVLPHARSLAWGPTNSVVELTEEEKRYVRQYVLDEANVYGQERHFVRITERPPMNHTYLAICEDPEVLEKAGAPAGTKLVKIGVSADTKRRLEEINGHHYAIIFGLEFRMYTTKRWNSQADALARETMALEWAEDHTQHASGEYFFMTDAQIDEAVRKVRPVTVGR